MFMALVYCNTCYRSHIWSVGVRCVYYKAALSRCKELGVSSEDYIQYLPAIQGKLETADRALAMASGDRHPKTPKQGLVQKEFCMRDVLTVLKDNSECKTLV